MNVSADIYHCQTELVLGKLKFSGYLLYGTLVSANSIWPVNNCTFVHNVKMWKNVYSCSYLWYKYLKLFATDLL